MKSLTVTNKKCKLRNNVFDEHFAQNRPFTKTLVGVSFSQVLSKIARLLWKASLFNAGDGSEA